MRCGGLNGCPRTKRSGCCHPACSSVRVSPEADDATTAVSPGTGSIAEYSSCLRSTRSGMLSWMNWAPSTAAAASWQKTSRSGSPWPVSPSLVRTGQAVSTAVLTRCSTAGSGSKTATDLPAARNRAVQLCPMTPPPTAATCATPSGNTTRSERDMLRSLEGEPLPSLRRGGDPVAERLHDAADLLDLAGIRRSQLPRADVETVLHPHPQVAAQHGGLGRARHLVAAGRPHRPQRGVAKELVGH